MKTKNILCLLGVSAVIGAVMIGINGCATMPKGAMAINDFDPDKYLGKWYEIARFDFRFERNMDNTTAVYSKNEDNSINVVNRGYNYKKGKWSEAVGKAKLVDKPNVGRLKVSFFGPFYSPYNIIKLDPEYKHALIVGKNTDYIWFLSRTPDMPEDVKAEYMKTAEELGFDLSRLVWVEHGNR